MKINIKWGGNVNATTLYHIKSSIQPKNLTLRVKTNLIRKDKFNIISNTIKNNIVEVWKQNLLYDMILNDQFTQNLKLVSEGKFNIISSERKTHNPNMSFGLLYYKLIPLGASKEPQCMFSLLSL